MDGNQQLDKQPVVPAATKRKFWQKPLFLVLAGLLLFTLGMAAGSGQLNISLATGKYNQNTGLPANLNYSSVEDVYDQLRSKYDGKLTEEQLLTGLKKGLAEATGDPYTEYFTAKEAQEFTGQVNGTFTGIGAELGEDKDGNVIIVAPIAGNPAEKAGLRAQDVIYSINGEPATGLSVSEAVTKIRGEKGTKVKLGIIRDKSESLDFEITRENIQIKSVEWEVLDDNIGYIAVSTFGEDTSELMAKAASELKNKNVKGVILDLRGNPGGLLDSAVSISGQWLPKGKLVLEEKRGAVVLDRYESDGPATLQGVPTIVLIDQGSASASEITAGALKDNGAARLIGEKSYGKGVVQQPICVDGRQTYEGCSGDMLKVTVASWYRPNGQNIDKKGIAPDQTVKISDADAEAQRDTQRQAAIDYLNKK